MSAYEPFSFTFAKTLPLSCVISDEMFCIRCKAVVGAAEREQLLTTETRLERKLQLLSNTAVLRTRENIILALQVPRSPYSTHTVGTGNVCIGCEQRWATR